MYCVQNTLAVPSWESFYFVTNGFVCPKVCAKAIALCLFEYYMYTLLRIILDPIFRERKEGWLLFKVGFNNLLAIKRKYRRLCGIKVLKIQVILSTHPLLFTGLVTRFSKSSPKRIIYVWLSKIIFPESNYILSSVCRGYLENSQRFTVM